MKLHSDDFAHFGPIPTECAFGRPHPSDTMALSDNRNPHLAWADVPAGTASFALLCIDTDAPSAIDKVNQTGVVVPHALRRQDFAHWVMIDIPAELRELAQGVCGEGVVSGGKRETHGPEGSRQGLNDYGSFMGDGDYFGYDGPCPPWNDERLHHYHFRLFALRVPKLDLPERFGAAEVWNAMQGQVLAIAEYTGTYTLNRDLL